MKMTNRYSNGNSWVLSYSYDESGKCVFGKGVASSGLSCTVTYEYEGGV